MHPESPGPAARTPARLPGVGETADLGLFPLGLVLLPSERAPLHLFEDGDHSFHVRKASGRTDAEVRAEMIATIAAWIDGVL